MLTKTFHIYYFLLVILLVSACQKPTVVGAKDYKTLGSSSHEILAASPYILMQLEINYMPGFAPDTAFINSITLFLQGLVNKPAGIQVISHQIESAGKAVLSLSDIVSIEKKNRTIFTGNDILGIHILITDGDYADVSLFGKSYWNTSFCLFGNTIKKSSGGIGQLSQSKLSTTIAEHELGHLIGLVALGSAMQVPHKDAANGTHCNNKNCLMYYAIETTASSNFFGNIPQLDANCKADLKANGGK